MKATLLIAAALLGTAAVAQTTPAGTDDANTMPAAGLPSTAPAMSDGSTATNAQAVTADTSNYPACSRTVTDKCVQRGAWHNSMHKAHPHH
jgi:hypothetical protein